MSVQSLFYPNDYNLFCNTITATSTSGSTSFDNLTITNNLTVDGEIFTQAFQAFGNIGVSGEVNCNTLGTIGNMTCGGKLTTQTFQVDQTSNFLGTVSLMGLPIDTGNWTASFVASSETNCTPNATSDEGIWWKIGNNILASFSMGITGITTPSVASFSIGGLPGLSGNFTHNYMMGTCSLGVVNSNADVSYNGCINSINTATNAFINFTVPSTAQTSATLNGILFYNDSF